MVQHAPLLAIDSASSETISRGYPSLASRPFLFHQVVFASLRRSLLLPSGQKKIDRHLIAVNPGELAASIGKPRL
jgi:hypothetical protein